MSDYIPRIGINFVCNSTVLGIMFVYVTCHMTLQRSMMFGCQQRNVDQDSQHTAVSCYHTYRYCEFLSINMHTCYC